VTNVAGSIAPLVIYVSSSGAVVALTSTVVIVMLLIQSR